MKFRSIAVAFLLFFLVGVAAFGRILLQYDEKDRLKDIFDKGNYLVSLIALHPLDDFDGNKRDFFLRTLTEYVSSEGLAYCLIQDGEGKAIISLAPRDLTSRIPLDIQNRSLSTMGLTSQSFMVGGKDRPFYEFAKPIFERGHRAGTVRLGFEIPPVSLFSMQRISILAMMAFLIFAASASVYYGMGHALHPLRKLYAELGPSFRGSGSQPAGSGRSRGIAGGIRSLERALAGLKEALNKTESENMEMAARLGVATFEKNQIYRIIDAINFGIIITDIQENVIYINSYMINLLQTTRKEAVDRPLGEVLESDEIMSFIAQQDSLEKTKTTSHMETMFPERSPGEVFQLSSSYMKDGEGAVMGKMISVRNITSEKSAENVQQEFIGNVAHEFLTPLTTIKSYNEMLMDGEVGDVEMQKEFYNTINEETVRLSNMVQNLLNIVKIEMGSLTLATGLVKTDWLVGDCMTAVEGAAQGKNITVTKNLPDNFPSLLGDKELLKTAIINLLGNAVKYTPENGKITFSLQEENSMVVFDFIDTGYGIPEEDLPHIFEKFYRSKDPKIMEEMGSGLGLAMTSQIINLHGGEIEVQSAVGEGTHFTIRIPKEDYYIGKK